MIAALSVSPPATEAEHVNHQPLDAEDSATKIGAMFPTVPEERIRELLKRCQPLPHAPPPRRLSLRALTGSPCPPPH